MAPSPDDMVTAVTESLAARTGRSLDEWLAPGQATHKLSLRRPAEVDDEVRHLLRLAYEQHA